MRLVGDVEEEKARYVRLLVCGMSTDVDEARELLEMMGLVEEGRAAVPKGPPPGLDIRTIKNVASTGFGHQ